MSEMVKTPPRIYLSPPHMSGVEEQFVKEAFESNWLAPLGPNVDAFEQEFSDIVGCEYAVALSSGTAALHLALVLAGVGAGDEVFVSTYTFCASVNPIIYQGAKPVFVDCESESWNMDPELLVEAINERAKLDKLPKAVVLVHLYGQSADISPVLDVCDYYGIPLIEDAAESLGATYKGSSPGTFGKFGAFSFNGNKIITTTGGGMLVTDDGELAAEARKLATQAREPAPHYEHTQAGYNYRLSNVLAGIGRGQLTVLEDRVQARRKVFDYYVESMSDLPGIEFMKEAPWGRHTRWHICITVDADEFGASREDIRIALDKGNIECRPTWKPMHMQPVFAQYERIGGAVSEHLFEVGLCLPSGSSLGYEDIDRVVNAIAHVR